MVKLSTAAQPMFADLVVGVRPDRCPLSCRLKGLTTVDEYLTVPVTRSYTPAVMAAVSDLTRPLVLRYRPARTAPGNLR
jgi:hypothetical protein